MSSTSLVSTLEETTSTLARMDRVTRRAVRWVITPIYWVLYVVCVGALALAIAALWRATHTGVWHDFWSKLRASFFSSDGPVFWLYIALCGSLTENIGQGSLRIREAALAGDDHLAPVVEEQPDGSLAPDLPAEPVIVGALRRPRGGSADARRTAGCLLANVFGACTLIMLLGLVVWSTAFGRLALIPIAAGCAYLTHLFTRMMFRTKRVVRIRASASALEWETEKRQTAVWSEIQALMMHWRDKKAAYPGGVVYAIETRHGMLTWELRGDASEEERRAHDRLARLVVRYSGQPLRDLSNSLQTLEDEASSQRRDQTHPTEPDGMQADHNPRESQRRGCRPNIGCLSILILYGAVLLLALAGVILQHV